VRYQLGSLPLEYAIARRWPASVVDACIKVPERWSVTPRGCKACFRARGEHGCSPRRSVRLGPAVNRAREVLPCLLAEPLAALFSTNGLAFGSCFLLLLLQAYPAGATALDPAGNKKKFDVSAWQPQSVKGCRWARKIADEAWPPASDDVSFRSRTPPPKKTKNAQAHVHRVLIDNITLCPVR